MKPRRGFSSCRVLGGRFPGRAGSTSSPHTESLKQRLHLELEAPPASVGVTPCPLRPQDKA